MLGQARVVSLARLPPGICLACSIWARPYAFAQVFVHTSARGGAVPGVTWVSTANHLILSCYLPDRSKGVDDYNKVMTEIQKIIKAQRGRGR